MSDVITDWIKTRREMEQAATEGPWEVSHLGELDWMSRSPLINSDGHQPGSCIGDLLGSMWPHRKARENVVYVADARTSLPKALDALEAVLELHVEGMCSGGYGCEVCEENFPCRTVAAITTALGVES